MRMFRALVGLALAAMSASAFSVGGNRDQPAQMDWKMEVAEGQRRAILAAVLTSVAAPLVAGAGDDAPTTLHIVNYPKEGSCGQADVPPTGVFFAKNLGGMVEGPCSKDGYTVPEGTASGIRDKDKERTYEIYGKES